jgi:hypothetical protein
VPPNQRDRGAPEWDVTGAAPGADPRWRWIRGTADASGSAGTGSQLKAEARSRRWREVIPDVEPANRCDRSSPIESLGIGGWLRAEC